MPTYQYQCQSCGLEFERFQSMNDEPVKRCPDCRCKVKRLIGTGAGIIFKGSGFYETDYRSESYEKGKKSDENKSKTKSSESSSSDSSSTSESSPKKKKDNTAKD